MGQEGEERSRKRRKKNIVKLPPADVITSEILPRLPATSLLRFTLVCKSWYSLIRNDPAFAYRNLRNARAAERLMIFSRSKGELVLIGEPKAVLRTPRRFVSISSPCDGLVCVFGYCDNSTFSLQLFNPTTREILPLPSPEDPFSSACYLCSDPSTNEYKVICHSSYLPRCQALTLGTDATWRRIGSMESIDCVNHAPHRSAAIGGFLFRVVRDVKSGDPVAALFDVREEKFRRLAIPTTAGGSGFRIGDVFDAQGHACYLEECGRDVFASGLHMWTLVDVDREVWTHRCLVPALGTDGVLCQWQWWCPDPTVVVWKEKLFDCRCGRVYCLPLSPDGSGGKKMEWEEVHVSGDDRVYDQAFPLAGSLISLIGILSKAKS